jgi:hypothetical protein
MVAQHPINAATHYGHAVRSPNIRSTRRTHSRTLTATVQARRIPLFHAAEIAHPKSFRPEATLRDNDVIVLAPDITCTTTER